MSARKTVDIATVRDLANRQLAAHAQSRPEAAEVREGIAALLESVLHQTGNYKGFRYLDGHEAVIAGEYDETARYYF